MITNKVIFPIKTKIAGWGIIAIGIGTIFSFLTAAEPFALVITFPIGAITSICGIFLLKRKKWAWIISVIMLVLIINGMLSNFYDCFVYGGSVTSLFCPHASYFKCKEFGYFEGKKIGWWESIYCSNLDSHYGYGPNFYSLVYAPIVLFFLFIPLLLLFLDRKKYWQIATWK